MRNLPNKGGDGEYSQHELDTIPTPLPRAGILPLHLAEAAAIRQAGEIREHVDEEMPFEGVMYWTDNEVHVFYVDWPETTDSSLIYTSEDGSINVPDPKEGRYYRNRASLTDYHTISIEEARELG